MFVMLDCRVWLGKNLIWTPMSSLQLLALCSGAVLLVVALFFLGLVMVSSFYYIFLLAGGAWLLSLRQL